VYLELALKTSESSTGATAAYIGGGETKHQTMIRL